MELSNLSEKELENALALQNMLSSVLERLPQENIDTSLSSGVREAIVNENLIPTRNLIGSSETSKKSGNTSIYVRDLEKRAQYVKDCQFLGWRSCSLDEAWWDYTRQMCSLLERGEVSLDEIRKSKAIAVVVLQHKGDIHISPRYARRGPKSKDSDGEALPVVVGLCEICKQPVESGKDALPYFDGRGQKTMFHASCYSKRENRWSSAKFRNGAKKCRASELEAKKEGKRRLFSF